MHTHSIEPWQHNHVFLGAKHDRHERRTWFVVALTAAMMVAEIVGGTLFGSMAVVAATAGTCRPMPARSPSRRSPTALHAATRAMRAFPSAPASWANWRRFAAP
ncbi:MAG: hypothetical protein ABSF41_06635 [Pseudolabrys sp.]